LIAILSLSLTAFSQTDTTKQPTKCFPIPVVKLIAKDLLSGDSAKAQLVLVEQQLTETENKVVMKDSVITLLREKEVNYQTIIKTQEEKYSTLESHTTKVESDLKKEKVKNKTTKILSGGVITTLTILLILL
jgi:hypothetical protein